MEILLLINNTKEVGETGPRLLITSNFALIELIVIFGTPPVHVQVLHHD